MDIGWYCGWVFVCLRVSLLFFCLYYNSSRFVTGSTSFSPYSVLLAVYHRKLFAFFVLVSFNLHLYNLHMQQNIICL